MSGKRIKAILGLCTVLCGGLLTVNPVAAAIIDVSMNTSALNGSAGNLVFDFTSLDGVQQNNTVGISLFSTDPDTSLGSASTLGVVSGSLPGAVQLRDRFLSPWDFTELAQEITFGDSLFFRLSVSELRGPGPGPDSLSIFLLSQDMSSSLVTSADPTMALMAVDVVGGADGVQVELFDQITLVASNRVLPLTASIRIIQNIVPEPGTLALLLLSLLVLTGLRRARCPCMANSSAA